MLKDKAKELFECEVNFNAYDTWLEPYIGWSFKVMRITKKKVLFFMDVGFGNTKICSHDKESFNISPHKSNRESKSDY